VTGKLTRGLSWLGRVDELAKAEAGEEVNARRGAEHVHASPAREVLALRAGSAVTKVRFMMAWLVGRHWLE